jgi:hypothetical protein
MILSLYRTQFLPDCTKGILYINGSYECQTLELPCTYKTSFNVHGKTCIFCGTYAVSKYQSKHCGYFVPLLADVPKRDCIEIHVANKPCEIHGCIAVGEAWSTLPQIDNSQAAFDRLMNTLNNAWKRGEEVTIRIIDLERKAHA